MYIFLHAHEYTCTAGVGDIGDWKGDIRDMHTYGLTRWYWRLTRSHGPREASIQRNRRSTPWSMPVPACHPMPCMRTESCGGVWTRTTRKIGCSTWPDTSSCAAPQYIQTLAHLKQCHANAATLLAHLDEVERYAPSCPMPYLCLILVGVWMNRCGVGCLEA